MGRTGHKTLARARLPVRGALRAWSRPLAWAAAALLLVGCSRWPLPWQARPHTPLHVLLAANAPGEITAQGPRSYYPDLLRPPAPEFGSSRPLVPSSFYPDLLKPPLPDFEPPPAAYSGPPAVSFVEARPAYDPSRLAAYSSMSVDPDAQALVLANRPASGLGKVVLNFDEADLRSVIRVIGDLVGINYVLDPAVGGTVTIQTAGKISVSELLPTLEQILAVNGFTMVQVGDLYRVVPVAQARQLPIATRMGSRAFPVPAEDRFIIQVIPVRFIPAGIMQEVVKPVVSEAAAMIPIKGTNSFILVDAARNVKKVLRLVEMLDTDAFDRIQAKLYPLDYVDPETLAGELRRMFVALGYSDASATLEFIPIPRLNALLVVNGLPDLASAIDLWTSRLDQPTLRAEEQTFVYYVQYGAAENISTILQSLYKPPEVAPEVPPTIIPSRRREIITLKVEEREILRRPGEPEAPLLARAPEEVVAAEAIFLFVVPDPDTNALIIRTKPVNYPDVLAVIKKLDRKPKQVIIETLIAEVTLTGDFEFGLEYAFRGSKVRSGGGLPIASAAQLGGPVATPTIPTSTAATALGGLSLFVTNPERFIATLDMLASEGNLNVVSSPSILTSENKEAEINVVTEVPIPRTTVDPNSDTTTTTFEFKEVGVKLKITPKINENGYVTLDIEEELSEIGEVFIAEDGDREFSFLTRSAKTSVVIKDNQTLIIGGLISESARETLTGIPILNRIPILKRIFGRTVITKEKTELIVMVTPRVVFDEADARAVTDLYNERLQSIQKLLKEHKAGRR
ncbi:MAG: type II secretion system secretin GspD [Nitrospinae bacterium]|nr:type II secretion system secretin GspD [Nitrospinota bacterium]